MRPVVPCSIALILALFGPLAAQVDHEHHGERLGRVAFPTSCGPAAQAHVERGVALLHSFWYEPAGRRVPGRRRRRLDVCDGLLGTGDEPAASAVDATGAGRAHGRARRGGAGGLGLARTPRERDYLAAIDAYYKDDAATDPKTRLQDSTTGTGSAVDLFRPDGGSTGMGVEYYVDLFGYNADSTVFVYDALAGTPTGSVRPRFQGRRITVRVPRALLGNDDGFLNAATVVGSESEPTDIAPENGHVRVGGASPAPRAGVSAARVGGQAHRGWL